MLSRCFGLGKRMEKENQTIANIIQSYLRYLKLERNYSTNTIEAYKNDLEHLITYCQENNKDVLSMQIADFEHFAFILHERKIGASSQARILSGVRSFYRYLVVDGLLEDNPTELLESPILGEHLPEVLSTEEVDQLQNSIERLVPISDKALHELEIWFKDRNAMNIKPGEQDYVFLNRRGAHLTRTMILIMIKKQAELAGIKETISPHTLRHSFATELLRGGADLIAIQAMLGHESVSTTEIYTHIDRESLRKAIIEHHPRNKPKYKKENNT